MLVGKIFFLKKILKLTNGQVKIKEYFFKDLIKWVH